MSGTPPPASTRSAPDRPRGSLTSGRLPLVPATRPPARSGLRRRQRAVGTLLVAAGLLFAVASRLGIVAVLAVVLLAQAGIAVLGSRLLPAADRWAGLAVVPGPLAGLALVLAADGSGAVRRLDRGAVVVAALGLVVVTVLVTELAREAWSPGGGHEQVESGQGRVERASQNLTLAVFVLGPVLAVAVGVRGGAPGAGRLWFALAVAQVAAGVGIRLGGSIVRAGGLSAGDLMRRAHPAAELLRRPVARALAVDTAVAVAAAAVTGGLLLATGVPAAASWVPAVLAGAATPLVLAGATTVLGLQSPIPAAVLAAGLGLALSAPLALLVSVHG